MESRQREDGWEEAPSGADGRAPSRANGVAHSEADNGAPSGANRIAPLGDPSEADESDWFGVPLVADSVQS